MVTIVHYFNIFELCSTCAQGVASVVVFQNFSVAQRLAQFLSDDKESRSTHPVLGTL